MNQNNKIKLPKNVKKSFVDTDNPPWSECQLGRPILNNGLKKGFAKNKEKNPHSRT